MYTALANRLFLTKDAFMWRTSAAFGAACFGALQAIGAPTITQVTFGPLAFGTDGSSAIGLATAPFGTVRIVRWSAQDGLQDLARFTGTLSSMVVSRDASAMLFKANSSGAGRWVRWTRDGGFQFAESLDSVSTDTYITGLSSGGAAWCGNDLSENPYRAFQMSDSVIQDLPTLGGTWTSAYAMSGDGTTVTGRSHTPNLRKHAFRWTLEGGMQNIGSLGGPTTTGTCISHDGSVIAGTGYTATAGQRPFRWTALGGIQDLGTAGGFESFTHSMSADGLVVVGTSDTSASSTDHAFIWAPALGMSDLNIYLSSIGCNLAGWVLEEALLISPDGSTIYGRGRRNSQSAAFIVSGIPHDPRPPCPADVGGVPSSYGYTVRDGAVNVDDLIRFVQAFDSGQPIADVANDQGIPSPDGAVNIADLILYLQRFEAGC
jgi:probable HAF family extracellular repeat protein